MSVAISLQDFFAVPVSKVQETVLIKWSIRPTLVDLSIYEFYVDKSDAENQSQKAMNVDIDGNPVTPAITLPVARNFKPMSLAISALNFYEYFDRTADFGDLFRNQYYRIRCRNKTTQEETTSAEFTINGNLDLVGLYIVDENNFLLEDTTGAPCFVYRRRSHGVLCKCFDPVQKLRKISNCTVCFGTNWVDGFHQEVLSYVDFSPSQNAFQITDWGATQPNEVNAMLSNWPDLMPGDVFRELTTQKMWRVTRIAGTEKRRVTMLQFIRCIEINPGDVEYKMDYNVPKAQKILEEFEKARMRREF